MSLIAVDVGGTKIAGALFTWDGKIIKKITEPVGERKGDEIAGIICEQINNLLTLASEMTTTVEAVGLSVPGIYDWERDSVWAPNLSGWESYPLKRHVERELEESIPVTIESDRTCYILGEIWMGNARNCKDAIFLAVGTGIGAGILVDGRVLHGYGNIAGAIGWMGLNRPYQEEYGMFGCFEYHASGEGLVRVAQNYLKKQGDSNCELTHINPEKITTRDIFKAFENNDPLAKRVIDEAVEFWGMAAANLVSIFNPEKIIFGGGVFETAAPLIDSIRNEAEKWAQPIAIKQVSIEHTKLGNEAGLYGAAHLADRLLNSNQ